MLVSVVSLVLAIPFRSFRWFCFGGFVLVVSVIWVVSFRSFRFVVLGVLFSFCRLSDISLEISLRLSDISLENSRGLSNFRFD